MTYATQRAVSDGTLSNLPLSIDYFDRTEISVYFDNVLATSGWAWVGTTDKTLHFVPTVPTGVEVTVRRTTAIDRPRNVFTEGAQFLAATLDENTVQVLRVAQELKEGVSIGDIFNDLTMHGHKITNVGAATNPGDAVSLGQIMADGTTFTLFSKVYMGAFAVPPVATSLLIIGQGALYFDTVLQAMQVYSGTRWVPAISASLGVQEFSGNAVTLAFNLLQEPLNENSTQVYISGVYQQKDTYSLVGKVLTFSEAPPVGTNNIEVVLTATAATAQPAMAVAGPASDLPTAITLLNNLRTALISIGVVV